MFMNDIREMREVSTQTWLLRPPDRFTPTFPRHPSNLHRYEYHRKQQSGKSVVSRRSNGEVSSNLWGISSTKATASFPPEFHRFGVNVVYEVILYATLRAPPRQTGKQDFNYAATRRFVLVQRC